MASGYDAQGMCWDSSKHGLGGAEVRLVDGQIS